MATIIVLTLFNLLTLAASFTLAVSGSIVAAFFALFIAFVALGVTFAAISLSDI